MSETPGFRFAEFLLYGYPGNCARLERLRGRLLELRAVSTCQAQGWEAADHSGGPGDPVGRRTAEIINLENEIGLLEQRTAPIAALMTALEAPFVLEGTANGDLAKAARMFYFGKMRSGAAAARLGVERTTFYRMRVKLVELTLKYMELVDMALSGK